MSLSFQVEDLTIDFKDIDLKDICSCWQWILQDMKGVVLISKMGDMFLIGIDGFIYWLQTDSGDLSKIADTLEHFESMLQNEQNIDNWFLPLIIEKLVGAGKSLQKNQVYSYKVMPIIGGEYSIENIEPVDISVHFAFSGQIAQQIQNLPDGTKVKIKVKSQNK